MAPPLGRRVDDPVRGRTQPAVGQPLQHVAAIDHQLARLRADGAQLIDDSPRRGLFGLQVAFVHPEATGGVLAEFVADGSK